MCKQLNLEMGAQYQQSVGDYSAAVPQEANHFNLVILECSYGYNDKQSDVTNQLQTIAASKGISH